MFLNGVQSTCSKYYKHFLFDTDIRYSNIRPYNEMYFITIRHTVGIKICFIFNAFCLLLPTY